MQINLLQNYETLLNSFLLETLWEISLKITKSLMSECLENIVFSNNNNINNNNNNNFQTSKIFKVQH